MYARSRDVEHGIGVVQPPGGETEAFERVRSFALGKRRFEDASRLVPRARGETFCAGHVAPIIRSRHNDGMKQPARNLRLVLTAAGAALVMGQMLFAQPRLTLDYPAMAKRLVAQLALKPGEKVLSLAQAGIMADLLPHLRYEVMRAGGIDLGVIEILPEPVPEAFDETVIARGARDSRAHYKAMFRDVDAAIMMPGATPAHPAYAAMQDWLKDDLTEHRGRRTIHFHWVENGSAYADRRPAAAHPRGDRRALPARAAADRLSRAGGRRAAVRGGAQEPARCASPRRPEPICAFAPAIDR